MDSAKGEKMDDNISRQAWYDEEWNELMAQNMKGEQDDGI